MSNSIMSVDPSLWWDPFVSRLNELENAPLSTCLPVQLEKKLKDCSVWLVNSTTHFKAPNEKSRDALSCKKLKIGSHELIIEPELKDKAIFISSYLCLDEVQSYIILERSLKRSGKTSDAISEDYLHWALIYYYIEKQCILKCVRQILIHAVYVENKNSGAVLVQDEVSKMVSEGLELKLISLFEELLFARHPEKMDADLFTLWAEEILTERSIVLEILFVIYHNSFCAFTVQTWKKLCSLYKGMLSGESHSGSWEVSNDAIKASNHAKVQLLIILIEGLDLENLLQLVHDAISFRKGLKFSIDDIQQIDPLISSFSMSEIKSAGPLYMAWAAFLCLLSSLPDKEEASPLVEIDQAFYAQHISEYDLFNHLINILDCDLLKQSDILGAGYKSVLRTFLCSFIASYEIVYQAESVSFGLMLDVICKIFTGEESLCVQFWDKASYIDSPIRCLLYTLEKEFPVNICPLIRLLTALSEGSWPALCVYKFLENVVGISTLFDISNGPSLDSSSTLIETQQRLRVPGYESLFIPSKTSGRIIKFVSSNSVLVRWELAQSGVTLLLMRLAQFSYIDDIEVALILNLFNCMMSSNLAVALSLFKCGSSLNLDQFVTNDELDMRYWLVDVTCSVVRKFLHNPQCTILLSHAVQTLSNAMKCFPYVSSTILQTNLFELTVKATVPAIDSDLSYSWLGSGKLAKALLIDSEVNCSDYSLTISVLDFTMQLLDTKIDEYNVLALISLGLQYVFVDHNSWRYRLKHFRWKVTLKVMELIKKCVVSIPLCPNLGPAIRHMLLTDSAIHTTLFGLVCVSKDTLENLSLSRFFDLMDIEGLHNAICSALDVLDLMISTFYKDISFAESVFFQLMISSTTQPVPATSALASFLTYLSYNEIQVGAMRVLSNIFMVAKDTSSSLPPNTIISLNDNQIASFRHGISHVLLVGLESDEKLFYHAVNMLTLAAQYQPALFLALLSLENGKAMPSNNSSEESLSTCHPNLLNDFVQVIENLKELVKRNSKVLFILLRFMRALWEGAALYTTIIEYLTASGELWRQISECILYISSVEAPALEDLNEIEAQDIAFKYQCLSLIVDIVSCENFLAKKFSRAESLLKSRIVKNEVSRNSSSNDNANVTIKTTNQAISCLFNESQFVKILHSCATSGYDNKLHSSVQVSISLFVVHIMEKLLRSDNGSLSLSFVRIVRETFLKMSSLDAFTEVMEHYLRHGYSSGQKLQSLVLTDLFYHLQGELEGRNISHGPFKELAQFLFESNVMQLYEDVNHEGSMSFNDNNLYDLSRLRSDIGLDLWKHTEWKGSVKVAKIMFDSMQKESNAVCIAKSKLRTLNSLATLFAINEFEFLNEKIKTETLRLSCIADLCRYFQSSSPMLLNSSAEVDFHSAQLQLIFTLVESFNRCLPPSAAVHVLKASLYGWKLSLDASLLGFQETKKHLLSLLVVTFKSIMEAEESPDASDVSNTSLALLPFLCKSIATSESYTLSLTAINSIINRFLEPTCWFPILCEHLPWDHIVSNLKDQSPSSSVQVTLKFILTLTNANGGVEKLHEAGLFQTLTVNITNTQDEEWRLRLAVITALTQSLGNDSLRRDAVANLVSLFFSENSDVISRNLSIPEAYSKKRKNIYSSPFSTSALSQMEQTFIFICSMSKLQLPVPKELKLKEKTIHLLSFISRGNVKAGEFSRNLYFSCAPLPNEVNKPSFVKTNSGWFAHAPYFCCDRLKSAESYPQTFFSDMVALQLYRITFLLLKFISVEAEMAVKRYEEAGFVNLTRVPELPVPEILHGLQDQAFAVVCEICNGNDVLNADSESLSVALLLIQILEMAVYLELCVVQICGIEPVLARLQHFTSMAKSLFKALEKHSALSSSLASLSPIATLINRETFSSIFCSLN